MFPACAFTPAWIESQRRQLGQCDPAILEKCVYALTLLGYLAESNLPFLFKGGTSLLLHLPQTRRLSRDIDIVCGEASGTVDTALANVGQRAPFVRWEEDMRGTRGLPQRRHFKFSYRSALGASVEQEVLLDIVEERAEVHTVVQRAIRTGFLEPEREILVRVPTVESLLGDKLTAFAPKTTGVPLRKTDGSAADVQQVAKQLFDVGVLFEAANDFAQIARSYDAISTLEASYRPTHPSRATALDDTLAACLALTATKKRDLAAYADAPLLHDGFDRLRGHLTWPEFGREHRRTLAARAAVLVAFLQSGRHLDFAAMRYTGSVEQIATLRTDTLNGTPYAWLDGLKAVNPEAYYYWHLAFGVGYKAVAG
ncbi:MAG: nucleotidyl transferase AbiEii/AbiGii toxin family protein [Opitutaceae bacterium]|jgi:predicted nucleotidyltransferase component of viral defense system